MSASHSRLQLSHTFHMGRVSHDKIARSIKKQFALMKKKEKKIIDTGNAIGHASITDVKGLISVCLEMGGRGDLEPGAVLLQIHTFKW